MSSKHDMSKSDASRIQSTQASAGRDMSSSGFASRAQSAGDRNANTNSNTGTRGGAYTGQQGGGNGGYGGYKGQSAGAK